MTAKKCTKRRDARVGLLFCHFKSISSFAVLFDVAVVVASAPQYQTEIRMNAAASSLQCNVSKNRVGENANQDARAESICSVRMQLSHLPVGIFIHLETNAFQRPIAIRVCCI